MIKFLFLSIFLAYSILAKAYIGSFDARCINCLPSVFHFYIPQYFSLTESLFLALISLLTLGFISFIIYKKQEIGVLMAILSVILIFLPLGLIFASYNFQYYIASLFDGQYQIENENHDLLIITHQGKQRYLNGIEENTHSEWS